MISFVMYISIDNNSFITVIHRCVSTDMILKKDIAILANYITSKLTGSLKGNIL